MKKIICILFILSVHLSGHVGLCYLNELVSVICDSSPAVTPIYSDKAMGITIRRVESDSRVLRSTSVYVIPHSSMGHFESFFASWHQVLFGGGE